MALNCLFYVIVGALTGKESSQLLKDVMYGKLQNKVPLPSTCGVNPAGWLLLVKEEEEEEEKHENKHEESFNTHTLEFGDNRIVLAQDCFVITYTIKHNKTISEMEVKGKSNVIKH